MLSPSAKSFTLAAVVVGATGMVVMWMRKGPQRRRAVKPTGLTVDHLRDPSIRENHLAFNEKLLREFPVDDAIELDDTLDGNPVFLVHRHERVMEVISDHMTFSSNPWPTTRSLVTLNTMEKADHDRVFKLLKKFYAPAWVAKLEDTFRSIVRTHGERFLQDGDAFKFTKRFHMHLSLLTSGMFESLDIDDPAIDEFIAWNDAAVRLAAPIGGVGTQPMVTVSNIQRLMRGVCNSMRSLSGLVGRIGIVHTLRLIEPLESVFPSAPYTHCWDYPEELAKIPAYFNRLYDLMSAARVESPAGALFTQIGYQVSASEAIATAVQLMVNMTTANGLMNLIFRRCEDPSVGADQVLMDEAPLQRNPRRAKRDGRIGSVHVPKGSIILLMIGSANKSCPVGATSTTFGFGLHHCLGRHLVSAEMRLVDEWLCENTDQSAMNLVEAQRLSDRDVGNWGFTRLRVQF